MSENSTQTGLVRQAYFFTYKEWEGICSLETRLREALEKLRAAEAMRDAALQVAARDRADRDAACNDIAELERGVRVPEEPTAEMLLVARDAYFAKTHSLMTRFEDIYRAMLSARPDADREGGGE